MSSIFTQRNAEKMYKLFMNPFFWVITIIILLFFDSFLNIPMVNDEGVWAFIGRIWADHGLLPYTGAIENKATGIYMLYAVSHKLFGFNIWFPRLVAMVSIVFSGLLIRSITKRISGSSLAAVISMAVFFLVMPLPVVDGAYAETETFMNLFRLLAFFLVLVASTRPLKQKILWTFMAGISFAWAIAFKQLAITDGLPLIFFFIYLNREKIKDVFVQLGIFGLGVFFGTFLSLIPFLMTGGTISDYIDGAWVILTQSGSSPHSLISRISGFFAHFFKPQLAFFTMGMLGFLIMWKKMKNLVPLAIPLLVWVFMDFLAYNADGWYLNHHFKVFLPSWSIVFGIITYYLIRRIKTKREKVAEEDDQKFLFVVFISFLLIFFIPFETNYFQNVRKIVRGDIQDYSLRDLGLHVREITKPNDYIYIWGFHIGPTYYYSDRLSSSRYFSEPFLGRPGALNELKKDLLDKTPVLIIVPKEKFPLPKWFQDFIDEKYNFLEDRSGHTIYRLAV